MPELPEVETITRELNRAMIGATVRVVDIRLPKMVKLPPAMLRRALIKARLQRVYRRAKLCLFDFSNGQTMVIHLKMSGQLIWQGSGRTVVGGHPIPGGTTELPNRYSHFIVSTSRGTLYFNDQRQFGFVRIIPTKRLPAWLESQGYGPEPLSGEFTYDLFLKIMRRHQAKRVKPVLLDQRVIAGIGNIYADEACHFSRVRPHRRIKTLSGRELKALFRGIRHVLMLSIRHGGTSVSDYRRSNGTKGSMNRYLRVYGRAGQQCHRCGTTIVKNVLAQRGTHFCPGCQR